MILALTFCVFWLFFKIAMEVYSCVIPGHTEEKKESDSVVSFIEEFFRFQTELVIYCDWENDRMGERGICFGYVPDYGVPYLSNPDWKRGLYGVDIDQKRLIYDIKGAPILKQRDSYRFGYQHFNPYVKADFQALEEAFLSAGYRTCDFAPQYVGDSITRHSDATTILET